MERWPSWSKAPLSKSGNSRNWVRGFESHSLRFFLYILRFVLVSSDIKDKKCYLQRRDAREAEGARLEIACSVCSGTVGSNPTLSAMHLCNLFDSWVLRNGNLRTPSGPEGSSGSKPFRVPQVA